MSIINQRETIVIKLGTNVLSREDGVLDITTISHLVDQVVSLQSMGHRIILVSSGAVGSGRTIIKNPKNEDKIVRRQIWASIGQIKLMNIYVSLFERYHKYVAQVLATKEDFRDRSHYLNMQNCLQGLIAEQVIPILNENDVIAVSELMFTDNDELASLISSMMNATRLIILSNVDGVYDGPPALSGSSIIREIDVDAPIEPHMMSSGKSSFGRGGMLTKYRMALKTARLGITTYIANGKRPNTLIDLINNEGLGTKFISKSPKSGIKRWLAYSEQTAKGSLIVNDGALTALKSGNPSSLLAVGVVSVIGQFIKGEIVQIMDSNHTVIGIGKIRLSSDVLIAYLSDKTMNLPTKVLIHYDYLLIH